MSSVQMTNGKAFEYALLQSFYRRLEALVDVRIIENDTYHVAQRCYLRLSERNQQISDLNASFATNFLIDLEPRLDYSVGYKDCIQLELAEDARGQQGDVRDVLLIRSEQKWEIGISAKSNHKAVKHSRLSDKLDFGQKWISIPCSDQYFEEIGPVFQQLRQIKNNSQASALWSSIGDYHQEVYLPVLHSFIDEIKRLSAKEPELFAKRIVEYLIGVNDFYKVIKGDTQVEIQAYNHHGTLNCLLKKENQQSKFQLSKCHQNC